MNFDIRDFNTKVFFIGYNKTATSTLNKIFKLNDFESAHNPNWGNLKVEKFQIFSDTGDVCIPNFKIEEAFEKYPNSIFVLNTRSLDKWLRSRCKHYYWRGKFKKRKMGYPITNEIIEKWIISRNTYYSKILNFFENKKDRFLIVNIEENDWLENMCKKFNIKYKNVFENKSVADGDKYLRFKDEVIESSYLQRIDKCIESSYENLNVKNPQSHLLINFTKDDT
tara:strand:+ start:932 stop:1603 length:672 start_codon:yes stop_codon:yes gene_type:complete